MRLTFRAYDFNEVRIAETRRLRQYRIRDGDFVIAGKFLNDVIRAIGDRRQSPTEFRQRSRLNSLNEPLQYVVEDLDLFVIEALGLRQEQISYFAQCLNPLFMRARANGILQFGNQ